MYKPFKEFFKQESSQRHWEVVAAARELALYFREHNGRIDKSEQAYQEKFERLSKALKQQSSEEKKRTTRYIQRQIVSGQLEAGVLYYLERNFVKATKAFRNAFQALSQKERDEREISPAVSPANGQKLLRALDQKSSDSRVLPVFMEFKSLLSSLGWENPKPEKQKSQQQSQQKEVFSRSDKKKSLIDKKMNSGISELDLPRNVAKKLSKNFSSVKDLKDATDKEISTIPGIGKKTLKQVREAL